MCTPSTPSVNPTPMPSPTSIDSSGSVAANRDAENRRRRYAASQMASQDKSGETQQPGAKKKLGE